MGPKLTGTGGNGEWNEYRRLLLHELGSINQRLDKLEGMVGDLGNQRAEDGKAVWTEIAIIRTELKIKSGLWGLLGGAIPAAIALIYILLK